VASLAGELEAAARVTDDECKSILLSIYDTYKDATIPLRYGADLDQQTKNKLTLYLVSH